MELSEEQQKVIDYDGSCLCIAGPGSGKTRTLVEKAEKLYKEGKDFICLTFTRSAASEMRSRMPGIQAQTIHSFCYGEVDWKGDYDRMLLDFNSSKVKLKFDYVLIDEVQDLSRDQLDVVLSIIGNKLFAVGDPYQSIYGFNGALGSAVMQELKSIGCKEFYLRLNYRSCTAIVEILNTIYSRGLRSASVKDTGLVTVLSRTNADVKVVSEYLESKGIGYTVRYGASELRPKKEEFHGSDKLKVMTCHCSKGLEFDYVILYNWFPEDSGEEMNLYYVSVARASKGFKAVSSTWEIANTLRSLNL